MRSLAAVDPQNYGGLLAFYREKIRLMENERIESISQFEHLKGSQKERHDMEWENFRLKNEIKELHLRLSEAKLNFFEEKSLLIKLQNDNENLQEALSSERVKVQQFLEFFRPTEQKVILKEMEKPKVEYKFVKNELNLENAKSKKTTVATHQSTKAVVKKSLKIKGANGSENCFNLQNFEVDGETGTSHIKRLAQLEAENEVLKQRIEVVYTEGITQKEILSQTIGSLESEIRSLIEKNQKFERVNLEINKQFFEQKLMFSDIENKLNEELELQKAKTLTLSLKLEEEQKGNELNGNYAQKLIESRVNESIKSLKSQLAEKQSSLAIIKEQYAQVQRIFKEKLRTLEETNKRLTEKVRLAERTKAMDEEGFTIDIKNLKDKIEELKSQVIYLSKENVEDNGKTVTVTSTKMNAKTSEITGSKKQQRPNSRKREIKDAVAQIQSRY